MTKKQSQKRLSLALACLALAVLLIPAAGRAMAYFTNYTETSGGYKLGSFTVTTQVTETVDSNKKTVSVKNTGTVPCYVRVRALAGEQFTIKATQKDDGQWIQHDPDDGWWYYTPSIASGTSTGKLTFTIKWDNDAIKGDFNVIVLEECTPVRYKPDGTEYPDWDAKAEEVGVQ